MTTIRDTLIRYIVSYVFLLAFLPLFLWLGDGSGIFMSALGAMIVRAPLRKGRGKPKSSDYALWLIALCGVISHALLRVENLASYSEIWKWSALLITPALVAMILRHDWWAFRNSRLTETLDLRA